MFLLNTGMSVKIRISWLMLLQVQNFCLISVFTNIYLIVLEVPILTLYTNAVFVIKTYSIIGLIHQYNVELYVYSVKHERCL